MNSVIGDIIAAGGTALIALHELAPARAILDRTVTLVDGRVAPAHNNEPWTPSSPSPHPASRTPHPEVG